MRRLLIILFTFGSVACGGVSVGDKPELNLTALDGSAINLANHKGKLILVDFWAGRSDLNRRHEQDLVDLYKKYEDQGVVFIGINCDLRAQDAQEYISDLKISWPQYWEPKGFRGGLGKEWGLTRVPTDFLIGPDGAVVWAGLKSTMDDVLADQILLHPPRLVEPDVLEQANHQLDAVENALKREDRAAAVSKFARVPDAARKDKAFAKRWEDLSKKVDAAAERLISDVNAVVASKQYPQAMSKLKELLVSLTGTSRETIVRKKINDLLANPDAKAAIVQAEKESAAAAALAAARKLRDGGDDISAYTHFKGLIQDYPNTPGAEEAANAVKVYERDDAFMQKVKDSAIATKAKAALSVAENYRINGKADLARAKFEQVVKDFPSTQYAQQAQRALDGMK